MYWSLFRSRALTLEMMVETDLVLVMAQSHKTCTRERFPEPAHKVYLLSEMSGPPRGIGDPMGQPIDSYRQALCEIDDLLKRGLDRIIALMNRNNQDR